MRIELTLDCCDLERMTAFWTSAAGMAEVGRIPDRFVSLSGAGLDVTLQRVPEPKVAKNRLHLDLLVDAPDSPLEDEVARLEALGASRLTAEPRREFGQTWFVLADPEGNEFCLARDPQASIGAAAT
jgi:catechol 2,3-dioxygenase-like lactoylglutathione lyase family enzyme